MSRPDWTIWRGGERPFDPEVRVYVRYRDGTESKIRVAGDLRWTWQGLNDDIAAYETAGSRYGEAGDQ